MTITAKDAGPALTRHITLLRAKSVERDGERFIEGWATRPEEDRMGDIVMPEGARFTLPLPLLFAHKHDEPIGSVIQAKVTKAGIRIRAKLTAGVARAEEVWRLIQDGALTAVSIGFQALKSTPLPGGGLRFDSWSWHELSIVSVPALPSAKIAVAKCIAYRDERHTQTREQPERLPAYTPVSDIREDFARAVASLPEAQRKHVSELRSGRTGRVWTMRDANGAEIATVAPTPPNPPKPKKAAPMTQKYITSHEMEKFSEQLGKSLGGLIADQCLKPLRALAERIEALEQENKSLRSQVVRGGIRYKGFWRDGQIYQAGDITTEQGSAWICLRETREKPHHSATDWNLFVRKGKDA